MYTIGISSVALRLVLPSSFAAFFHIIYFTIEEDIIKIVRNAFLWIRGDTTGQRRGRGWGGIGVIVMWSILIYFMFNLFSYACYVSFNMTRKELFYVVWCIYEDQLIVCNCGDGMVGFKNI